MGKGEGIVGRVGKDEGMVKREGREKRGDDIGVGGWKRGVLGRKEGK